MAAAAAAAGNFLSARAHTQPPIHLLHLLLLVVVVVVVLFTTPTPRPLLTTDPSAATEPHSSAVRLRHTLHWKTSIIHTHIPTSIVCIIMCTPGLPPSPLPYGIHRRSEGTGHGVTSISSHRPNKIIIIRFNCPYFPPPPTLLTARSRVRFNVGSSSCRSLARAY